MNKPRVVSVDVELPEVTPATYVALDDGENEVRRQTETDAEDTYEAYGYYGA